MQLYDHKTADNLNLQAVSMPGTNVVTVLILVGAGSRYETKQTSGISHFLEHMFFKGAKKYQTPKSVAMAIDSFGGEFNAFTGKEYVGYYVKAGQNNLEKALDVLSDMLLHSTFPDEEIEKERGVILEEMAMYLDAPMYQISWDFERLIFGDQPLGWDQIGTAKFLQTVPRQQFIDYKDALYVPKNMVVTVAGAVNKTTLATVEKYFGMQDREQSYGPTLFDPALATKKFKIREKKTEQYHISFGVRTLAETDPRFPVLKILATILGGNMSSRMFQNVREQKGLCYSIRTQVDEFTDTSLLTTHAGVKLENVIQAVSGVREEYDKIIKYGIEDEELKNAKQYLTGKLDLQTEDTEAMAHYFAKNHLLYQSQETLQQWKQRLQSVDKEQVEELAKEVLVPENFRFAGIGPQIDEGKLMKLIG